MMMMLVLAEEVFFFFFLAFKTTLSSRIDGVSVRARKVNICVALLLFYGLALVESGSCRIIRLNLFNVRPAQDF